MLPLTHDQVRDALDYNPETGILTWRYRATNPKRWNTRYAGTEAGVPNGDGAIRITLCGHKLLAHRLIWFWMTAEWVPEIDHKDRVRSNNKWNNLRQSTHSQNMGNQGVRATNTSGYKGVSWDKKTRKWYTKITVRYQQVALGFYDCPAAASLAYVVAANKYFGSFSRIA